MRRQKPTGNGLGELIFLGNTLIRSCQNKTGCGSLPAAPPQPPLNLKPVEALVPAPSLRRWTWPGEQSSVIKILKVSSELPFINDLFSLACLFRAGSARGSSSPGPSASVAASRRSSPGEVGLHEEPTLPVQRKLAWDEEEGHRERDEAEIAQEKFTVTGFGNPKDEHGNIKERNERYVLVVPVICLLTCV